MSLVSAEAATPTATSDILIFRKDGISLSLWPCSCLSFYRITTAAGSLWAEFNQSIIWKWDDWVYYDDQWMSFIHLDDWILFKLLYFYSMSDVFSTQIYVSQQIRWMHAQVKCSVANVSFGVYNRSAVANEGSGVCLKQQWHLTLSNYLHYCHLVVLPLHNLSSVATREFWVKK